MTPGGPTEMESSHELIRRFLEAAPGFTSRWEAFVADEGAEATDLSYPAMAEFAGYLIDSYEARDTAFFAAVFQVVERLLTGGDEELVTLMTVGLFEDLQGIAGDRDFDPDVFKQWLGERSAIAWADVNAFGDELARWQMRSGIAWAFGGLGSLVLVAALVLSGLFALREIQAVGRSDWPTVRGSVVASELTRSNFAGDTGPDVEVAVRFTYELGDTTHSAEQEWMVGHGVNAEANARGAEIRYAAGADVTVYCDPGDYDRAGIKPGRPSSMVIAAAGIVWGTALLLGALWAARWVQRRTAT